MYGASNKLHICNNNKKMTTKDYGNCLQSGGPSYIKKNINAMLFAVSLANTVQQVKVFFFFWIIYGLMLYEKKQA